MMAALDLRVGSGWGPVGENQSSLGPYTIFLLDSYFTIVRILTSKMCWMRIMRFVRIMMRMKRDDNKDPDC